MAKQQYLSPLVRIGCGQGGDFIGQKIADVLQCHTVDNR